MKKLFALRVLSVVLVLGFTSSAFAQTQEQIEARAAAVECWS